MKTIRNITILLGLFLAPFALPAIRANAQAVSTVSFRGTFTLPFEAQWGVVALPAGQYSLQYGLLGGGSAYVVEVTSKEKARPHVLLLPQAANDTSAAENALVCVREGNRLVVRALDLPAIGKSVSFPLPHGAKLIANRRSHNGYTQIAQAAMLIQRVPVIPNRK